LAAAGVFAASRDSGPQTPKEVELGKKLFFEPLLSADGSVSCATWHDPERAFTDGRPARPKPPAF
jgi:cytochrome c peroxidase